MSLEVHGGDQTFPWNITLREQKKAQPCFLKQSCSASLLESWGRDVFSGICLLLLYLGKFILCSGKKPIQGKQLTILSRACCGRRRGSSSLWEREGTSVSWHSQRRTYQWLLTKPASWEYLVAMLQMKPSLDSPMCWSYLKVYNIFPYIYIFHIFIYIIYINI